VPLKAWAAGAIADLAIIGGAEACIFADVEDEPGFQHQCILRDRRARHREGIAAG